uniref:Uncharacterized protein n=1 Tax=viral metagenome TaxID=1070528 RepID=A0A6C0EYT4_9ZZZZ
MGTHLYICINVPLLQAAIAHVAHSPVGTRLYDFTKGSEFESQESRCKFSVQLNRHGAEVDFKALDKL